ncbi:hypothetical protein PGB90_008563 [Kerria lacca]
MLKIIAELKESEEDERIKAIYLKCKEETQIEENEMETFKKMELPVSNKGKIVNGKFYKEGAIKVAEKYYFDKQEEMEKAKVVIDICEKQIENETEECDIAGKLASCVIEEAQKDCEILSTLKNWLIIDSSRIKTKEELELNVKMLAICGERINPWVDKYT